MLRLSLSPQCLQEASRGLMRRTWSSSRFSRFLSTYQPIDPKTLDFKSLGFSYIPTKSCALLNFKDGKWEENFVLQEPYIKIHVLANVLHYGQALFEGLKAFEQRDGKIVLFNPKENVNRMNKGAQRLSMPLIPEKVYLEMMKAVVKDNIEYVSPYGSGGAMYLRPFYFGNGCQIGLGAAKEYTFGIMSVPVGEYYKGGLKAVDGLIVTEFDRAAPLGVGNVKTAGNYAADILPASVSASKGFPISLYLDSKENKYIEEFSTSNFIAITKDGKSFVTPDSHSILDSITNKMLQTIAEKEFGLKVEKRKVDVEELFKGNFSEVAACGTAVVVTPIKSITFKDRTVHFKTFDTLKKLYDKIRQYQNGEIPDKYGWSHFVINKGKK